MQNGQVDLGESYQIIGQIGSGGGGTVYKAYHKRLQKFVVIKKMHGNFSCSSNNRRETDVLKNLRHTYLPQVLDFIETQDAVYTVMDFIEGQSFQQLLDQGRTFTLGEAARYGSQLCEALEYLHTRKIPIIHGDVKPANIMLTPENNICLIDFNISGFMSGTGFMSVGYTSGYASPEQVRAVLQHNQMTQQMTTNRRNAYYSEHGTEILGGDPQYTGQGTGGPLSSDGNSYTIDNSENLIDERADIYSAGAFVYALITGKKPDSDYSQIVPLSVFKRFSSGFANAVDKAMEYDPRHRYATAAEFGKALRGYSRIDRRYKTVIAEQRILYVCLFFGIMFCAMIALTGRVKMKTEKSEYYDDLVSQMDEARTGGSEDEFDELYDKAVKTDSKSAGAYWQKARYLYEQKEYDKDIDYIEASAVKISTADQGDIGDLYFIEGNSQYEIGDYAAANNSYLTAIRYNDTNPEYYSDYAISLVETGQSDEAEKILQKAVDNGLAEDQLYLVKGEIEKAKGNMDEARSDFTSCIGSADDDYTKMRAYIMMSKTYDSEDNDQQSLIAEAELLEKARTDVAADQQANILERLAQAYIDLFNQTEDTQYANKALNVFGTIMKMGWDSMNTYNNIVVMYERSGNLQAARQYADKMCKKYGDRYESYKRLAFIEIDVQNAKDDGARDYSDFLEYYKKATELYKDQVDGNKTDAEMQMLDQNYGQLKSDGLL